MKKTLFDTLAEMNKEDSEKGTRMVEIGNQLISMDKVKGGAKIAMGMPESCMKDILLDKKIPLLILVDKEEYFTRYNS
jgi:hypothetical protein